jgi:hypothetical protein
MSDIASWLRSRWVELAWGAFALVNLVAMFRLGLAQTVPFHFVWVSLTLVYGFRIWRLETTVLVCAVVCAVTAVAFLRPIAAGWAERRRGHRGAADGGDVPGHGVACPAPRHGDGGGPAAGRQ